MAAQRETSNARIDAPRVRLRLLGRTEVSFGPHYDPVLLPRSAEPMVGFVALGVRRAVPREVLAEAVWSSDTAGDPGKCLRTAMWRLNRCLGKLGTPLIECDHGTIRFRRSPGLWIDVTAFETRLRQVLQRSYMDWNVLDARRLQRALNLYSGEFLQGHDFDWLVPERQKYQELYLDGLSALTAWQMRAGLLQHAKWTARQALRLDPLREDLHRCLMRIFLDLGQRSQAVLQYRDLGRLLEAELGIAPMDETRRLLEAATAVSQPNANNADVLARQAADRFRRVQRSLRVSAKDVAKGLTAAEGVCVALGASADIADSADS